MMCSVSEKGAGKQLALLETNSAVRTCGFDFGGNIIMFSTDKQMGYQCFVNFFDLRDPSQIEKERNEKLFDSTTLEHQKSFRTERPVNSAAVSPIYDHVVLGGGQEAMDVTTTSTRIGKFEARFFHVAVEEEFGRVKGHFGPINSLAFHPDGKR
ncbi:hypothetical protein AB205_0117200 [Aquarana catesbeiana]|uniref:Uncharacterized protein n=1 Tax=Aquarana catesbeiana TaxID=8400 RepID=A0A2G9RYC9_AQUCT|nr:hypothetical protein AB205_0117200 [Aquarana catesbeiana]